MDGGAPLPERPITEPQLRDLAAILHRRLGRGMILWLLGQVLRPEALGPAANHTGDAAALAHAAVEALAKAGQVLEAAALLRQTAHGNSRLALELNRVLRGERLDGDARTQALLNEYEPFFNSATFAEWFARAQRVVCAIALGEPENNIVGTGFLVGPDLVLTNYHVLEQFLAPEDGGGGPVKAGASGDQIFFFFDYIVAPKPRVPPELSGRDTFVTAVKDDWLVHARRRLPNDGKAGCAATVTDEYDYALVRLARKVGEQPVRRGGGPRRGWLSLPEKIDVLDSVDKRLVVLQHPAGAEQQFDVGAYDRLDASQTRVWYALSTAKGSSGAAALDKEGRLFALHNAEVEPRPELGLLNGKGLNQGIRIDFIAKDLGSAKLQGWPVPAFQDHAEFWSLNDDLANPRPIIGRSTFRDDLLRLATIGSPERALVVTGRPGSGRRFSVELWKRVLGGKAACMELKPDELSRLTPRKFLENVGIDFGLEGECGPIPDERKTEDRPRWLTMDAPRWLAATLHRAARRDAARYPAWIIVNSVVPEGEPLSWADGLKELFAALLGAADAEQRRVDIPELRWLFLGASATDFPLLAVPRVEEDLSRASDMDGEFVKCLQGAYRALDKTADIADEAWWRAASRRELKRAPEGKPPRAALAEAVRELLAEMRSGGGE